VRKQAQNFGKVVERDMRIKRDLLRGERFAAAGGERHHRPKSVFGCLGEHFCHYTISGYIYPDIEPRGGGAPGQCFYQMRVVSVACHAIFNVLLVLLCYQL
jgi:hypothetical protein